MGSSSNSLKGLTVEIGGDTTKLGAALTGVNGEIQNLQDNLRKVETALKLDPGNLDALRQKQQLLGEAVTATAQKLETLKEAQRQADETIANGGEVDQTAYRNLQTEIARTEASLNNYKQQAKDVGQQLEKSGAAISKAFTDAGEAISKTGEKISDAGEGFSKISGAVAALGVASVAAWKSMDEGYDTIITKTGATGEALEGMNRVAEKLFTSMPVGFADASAAVGEVNTRFQATGTELEQLSRSFLQFSSINNQDVSTAVDNTDKILQAFNLSSKDAGSALDAMTKAGQQTGVGMDALQNALMNNASTFNTLHMNLGQSISLISQFEANGVDTTTAMTGLRKAVLAYTDSGMSMDEALQKTLGSIKNAKSDTDALAKAQEIFGSKAAVVMADAIRSGRIDLDSLSNTLKSTTGAVENTYKATLDPIDNITIAFNKLKLAGADLGGKVLGALSPMFERLANSVSGVAKWFGSLSPTMQSVVLSVAGIVAALGPALITIGKVVSAVGTITSAVGKIIPMISSAIGAVKSIGTAISALNAVMLANPIALIVVAIAALVAAFVILWNKCEGFRNFWIGLWNGIKSVFEGVVNWFKTASANIVNFFTGAVNGIKSAWSGVTGFFAGIRNGITNAFSTIGSWFSSTFTAARNGIQSAWSGVTSWFGGVKNGITNAFASVDSWMSSKFGAAWSAVKSVFSPFVAYFRQIWETVKGIFSAVTSVFRGDFSGAWEAIKGIFSGWGNFFKDRFNDIKNVFSGILGVGKSIVEGLWNGISSRVTWLRDKIRDWCNGIVDTIKSWFGIHSPSTLMRDQIGAMLARGMGEGVADNESAVLDPLDKLKDGVTDMNGLNVSRNISTTFGDSASSQASADSFGALASAILAKLDELKDFAVYIDKKALVGKLARDMDTALGEIAARKAVGAV